MWETLFNLNRLQRLYVVAVETASAALNLVNGYDFKGKPVIIAYGKKIQVSSEIVASRTDSQTDIISSCLVASERE